MPRSKSAPRLVLKRGERGREAVWIIRDGTHRQSTGFNQSQRQQAEQALALYITEKYTPPTGLGQRLLIDEVVAAYLKDKAEHPSFRNIMSNAKAIVKWWSGKRIADVTKTNCQAYVKWRTSQNRRQHPNSKMAPQKVTIATAWRDLKCLRAAIRSFKAEHDTALVVPTVTLPPTPPARQDYWLTRQQVAARLNAARKSSKHRHLCRHILIEIYSGTRQGAIFQLRWVPSPTAGWVDLENGILHRAGTAESGKETKKRKTLVRIHARLLPHLRRWRDADMARGITHVIHYQGRPITRVESAWRGVARAVGAQGRDAPHILRHTAATWLMRSRVNIFEAAGYLGMSPETLTSRYGHHHPDFQSAAATATGKK